MATRTQRPESLKKATSPLERAKAAALRRYRIRRPRARSPHVATTDPQLNVVGVGIGVKMKDGRPRRRTVLHIYVVNKFHPNAIPRSHFLPEEIQGIETDIIETGHFHFASNEERPAKPGMSIGAIDANGSAGTFGTFGALVSRNDESFLLSCNHVLADLGRFGPGTAIVQPAPKDGGGEPQSTIASLIQAFPLRTDQPNLIDAAIAKVGDLSQVGSDILPPIGALRAPTPIPAAKLMRVEKVGRTTGFTEGLVIATAANFPVDSSGSGVDGVLFANQILIQAEDGVFSAVGDSGALVIATDTGRATGLIVANSNKQRITAACHIEDVLRLLRVGLIV